MRKKSGSIATSNETNLSPEEISLLTDELSKLKTRLSYQQFLKLMSELIHKIYSEEDYLIPVSVLENKRLGPLEAIVKYLKEKLGLRYKKIASLTGRNEISIGNCYRIAKRKLPEDLEVKLSEYTFPVSVVKHKELSVLEAITFYLKNTYALSFHNIAVLLGRDDRTIWTVYNRAMRKLQKKK